MMPTEHAERAPSIVHRLLAAFVGQVCQHPRLVLAAALVLCGVSVGLATTKLQYRTQRDDLMREDLDCQKRWRAHLNEFGSDDDMVVVVKGNDSDRMILALEALAQRLKERPDLFDRLFYRVDLRPLADRALLFLPTEQIRSIRDHLEPMRPLLGLGPAAWKQLTIQNLIQTAQFKTLLLQPGRPLSPGDEQLFRQLTATCRGATALLDDPVAGYQNPWAALSPANPGGEERQLREPQYFFTPPREGERLAFLLVQPVLEKGSFTGARTSVEVLRGLMDEIRPEFPDLDLGLTGLPVLENDEMVASRRDTELASFLAFGAVGLLYLVVFRSLWYPLLTVGTLLVGIAWAMGWLALTVGHLNILSMTFAVMLIAMGDYGVLWVTRYEQARRGGMSVPEALRHTATHVAVGNLTAATALALAFFAAMFADFQAVAELGWIAGCGVLLCAAACFTVLPAVLMLTDRRNTSILRLYSPNGTPPPESEAAWLPILSRRPVLVLGLGLALFLGIGSCLTRVGYDHNLLHLQDQSLDSVRWEHLLIEHTEGASWYALTSAPTPQAALALKARFETLPEVSRVVEVAALIPPDQEAKLPLLTDIHDLLKRLPPRGERLERSRPDTAEVLRVAAVLSARLEPLASSEHSATLQELRGALLGLIRRLARDGKGAGEILQEYEIRMAGDLAADLHRLRDVATPRPIQVADLPEALRQRFVGQNGRWLLRVFARDSLWDYGPLEHFTHQVAAVDPEATGKPFGTIEGLRSLKEGFTRAGLYALGVIVLVLLADFRSPRRALIAIAPLAAGLLLSLGMLGLLGRPLNPANIIALPLILGVGVDNGVHILHDALLRRQKGQSTISRAIGRGVLLKAVTTMIGFAALMVSGHCGLFGLGFVLTLGVGCCMVTALILLPAVLGLFASKPPFLPADREEMPLAA